MARTIHELRPKSAAVAPSRNYNAATAIDLSTAQNEVVTAELQEFLKTTIEDNLAPEVNRPLHADTVRLRRPSILHHPAEMGETKLLAKYSPRSSTHTSIRYTRYKLSTSC
jgi:hypothetical protein